MKDFTVIVNGFALFKPEITEDGSPRLIPASSLKMNDGQSCNAEELRFSNLNL